jgi:hypothetical protein
LWDTGMLQSHALAPDCRDFDAIRANDRLSMR